MQRFVVTGARLWQTLSDTEQCLHHDCIARVLVNGFDAQVSEGVLRAAWQSCALCRQRVQGAKETYEVSREDVFERKPLKEH